MFESDADRLAMIKGLGGQLVRSPSGEFWAIFDRPSALTPDGAVETRQSVLVARTADVEALTKDTPLSIGADEYRIKRLEPDGTGMTTIILKR